MSAPASDDLLEWRESLGSRLMLAMTCTHEGDDFGASAVCRTCFANTQSVGAIVEAEVRKWTANAAATASDTLADHLDRMDRAGGGIYTADFRDGFRLAVLMLGGAA